MMGAKWQFIVEKVNEKMKMGYPKNDTFTTIGEFRKLSCTFVYLKAKSDWHLHGAIIFRD